MLTWTPPPATGLGDRMGGWMVLLALAKLRNETVWLNWAPGWFRLPARIAQDSQAALACISFPSFAHPTADEGEAAVRSVPLMWHKRTGGFGGRPRPGSEEGKGATGAGRVGPYQAQARGSRCQHSPRK